MVAAAAEEAVAIIGPLALRAAVERVLIDERAAAWPGIRAADGDASDGNAVGLASQKEQPAANHGNHQHQRHQAADDTARPTLALRRSLHLTGPWLVSRGGIARLVARLRGRRSIGVLRWRGIRRC